MQRTLALVLVCFAGVIGATGGGVRAAQEGNGLTGHLGVGLTAAPETHRYGMSFYSSVFTLNPEPAEGTQLGAGTWIIPDNQTFTQPLCPVGTIARDHWPERGPTYRDVYQTLEGGVGQWGSTHFPSSSPKFRINAVPDCYNTQISSPAWQFGGEPLAGDKLGLAQLSNRLLIPPDGIVLARANVASLLGYGWFALPFIPAYTSPAGVPTGGQSWTLILNSANFKGPVAFFTPETWSAVNAADRTGTGRGHDTRPGYSGAVALEIGITPMFTATDAAGVRYRRVPRLTFPVNANRTAVLLQDVRFHSKDAVWNSVANAMRGVSSGMHFNNAASFQPQSWYVNSNVTLGGASVIFDETVFAPGTVQTSAGGWGVGLRWGGSLEAGVYPEYYREEGRQWRPVPASQVPPETRLAQERFNAGTPRSVAAVATTASSPWSSAAWRAGPFSVRLADGSMVDYVWYKFSEQPAIARLSLGATTLQALQGYVESLHRQFGLDGPTFPPPSSGALTTIDAAQFVTPPAGLERGYVPIVIRQYAAGTAPTQNYSDLWWNPDESGWGMSITQHGAVAFAAWYIYGDDGRPTWVVMPGGQWTTPASYTGDLYTTTGPDPVAGAFDPAQVAVTRAGTGTLAFSSNDRGVLSYQVGSRSGSKPIQRQPFGAAPSGAAATVNYGDLWWNAAESGWGLSITQKNRSLFAVWYIYGTDRQPTWHVMSGGSWTSADTWTGELYRTRVPGAPFLGAAFNPSGVQVTAVGSLTLRFASPESATMTYTIDGVTGSKAITRQPF